MTKKIGIIVFDDVEELDAIGPWEILSYWTKHYPEDGYTVTLVAENLQPVTAAKGLQFLPQETFDTCGKLDIIIHPGGIGTRKLAQDQEYVAVISQLADSADIAMSVCTGALVYAAAHLLQNQAAITHWVAYQELLAIDPSIILKEGERWVDVGKIITSAGISAGIDASFYLISRLISPTRMAEVQKGVEYFPAPPAAINS